LEAYRQGLDTADAVLRACGVDKKRIEKGYRDFLVATVKGIPRTEKPLAFAELESAHKKNPDDLEITARLAAEYLRRGKTAEAKKLTEQVLSQEKGHATAAIVQARILQREKNLPGAREVLETARRDNPENLRVLSSLGRFYLETHDREQATAVYEEIRKKSIPDTEVLETLAKLYTASMKTAALVSVLAELAARTPDDLEIHLKLAKLHHESGHEAEAAVYAREALYVDVLNEEARRILLAALRAQKQDQQAEQLELRFKP
jgi:thioredoxin-like negative regulator of GroEL